MTTPSKEQPSMSRHFPYANEVANCHYPSPPPHPYMYQPAPPHPGHPPPSPYDRAVFRPPNESDPTASHGKQKKTTILNSSSSSHSARYSSSVESQGGSSKGIPVPYVGYPPHMMPGGLPPPPGYYPYGPPIEYIEHIRPQDVLSGRGGATNSHSGNKEFRSLVKQYQEKYLLAKKRDKPSVAAEVVHAIREKGGRFLQKAPQVRGRVLYYEIGDQKANEKCCQALREGAPRIMAGHRRSFSSTNVSSEDDKKYSATGSSLSPPKKKRKYTHRMTENELAASSSSSFDHTTAARASYTPSRMVKNYQMDSAVSSKENTTREEKTLTIKPAARLVRHCKFAVVSVKGLAEEELGIYIQDFQPPVDDSAPPVIVKSSSEDSKVKVKEEAPSP